MEHVPAAKVRSMVDTGELADRAVAERAGIGWSAKNCSIITPEFGSYVYLGEMITNIPFAPDVPMEDECGDCTLCLDACPTGALIQGGQFKCTTLHRIFDADENTNSGGVPCKNWEPPYTGVIRVRQFARKIKESKICISKLSNRIQNWPSRFFQPVLSLSNSEFKEKFGHVSGSWRGEKSDSAKCDYCTRTFKDEDAVPELIIYVREGSETHH